MFSVKAKPVAVTPAVTTPSTIPVKCRRRKRKTSSTAVAFADSSTTGAMTVMPRVSAPLGSAVATAIQWVAKLFAMIATSAAAHAPQAKQNARLRQGPGSTRSSQRKAAISRGTGNTARPSPTRKPSVPVCCRTRARMTSPDSASSELSAAYRTQVRCHQCGCRSTPPGAGDPVGAGGYVGYGGLVATALTLTRQRRPVLPVIAADRCPPPSTAAPRCLGGRRAGRGGTAGRSRHDPSQGPAPRNASGAGSRDAARNRPRGARWRSRGAR